MDESKYKIEIDPQQLFARLTPLGFWDMQTVDRYTQDVEDAFERAAAAGDPTAKFRILIDLRNHGVQTREVSAQIQDRLIKGVAQASRVAVLLSESALRNLQAQRLGSHIGASFFADEAQAMTWLYAQ